MGSDSDVVGENFHSLIVLFRVEFLRSFKAKHRKALAVGVVYLSHQGKRENICDASMPYQTTERGSTRSILWWLACFLTLAVVSG